jgi:hypothetical protein
LSPKQYRAKKEIAEKRTMAETRELFSSITSESKFNVLFVPNEKANKESHNQAFELCVAVFDAKKQRPARKKKLIPNQR